MESPGPRWSAPESLALNKRCILSKKTDVYSFGMLMYELITRGSIPFRGKCEKIDVNSFKEWLPVSLIFLMTNMIISYL